MTHILSRKAAGLWPDCHNIIPRSLNEETRPYLFADFAWTILLWGQNVHHGPSNISRYLRSLYRRHTNRDGNR